MDNYDQNQIFPADVVENIGTRTVAKNFMANVFMWMFIALGVSAAVAFYLNLNDQILTYLFEPNGKMNLLGWVIIFAPLGFSLILNLGYYRFSVPVILLLFLALAAVNGFTFWFILLIYNINSIVTCFASTAGMFGVMAIMGYTTKHDLMKFGSILRMGVIGVILAVVINVFVGNRMADIVISIIGVMVFTGLTAYNMQYLKRVGAGLEYGDISADQGKKLAVLGGLTLYISFINIFLFVLRLFGGKK